MKNCSLSAIYGRGKNGGELPGPGAVDSLDIKKSCAIWLGEMEKSELHVQHAGANAAAARERVKEIIIDMSSRGTKNNKITV